MRLGIIARCDNSGLGNQTLELVKMLNPDKVLVVDFSSYSKGLEQFPERYSDWNHKVVVGAPNNNDVFEFIDGLDAVLSCEWFYNKHFVNICIKKKVKTMLQYNYEFLEYLNNPNILLPDALIAPTTWNIEEVDERFGKRSIVEFIPPPTDDKLFEHNRSVNSKNTNKLLHVAGKAAAHDRNGTNSVLQMLKYSKQEYELVIKSQTKLNLRYRDERVIEQFGDELSHSDLYSGFDGMILPRRYAGLCLPMNEALMSGLPVFMTDISPNRDMLPKGWLAQSSITHNFMTKAMIDVHAADPRRMAAVVDGYFSSKHKSEYKEEAFRIGYDRFSPAVLKEKYLNLIDRLLTKR
mgnify:CR=1 FL=1